VLGNRLSLLHTCPQNDALNRTLKAYNRPPYPTTATPNHPAGFATGGASAPGPMRGHLAAQFHPLEQARHGVAVTAEAARCLARAAVVVAEALTADALLVAERGSACEGHGVPGAVGRLVAAAAESPAAAPHLEEAQAALLRQTIQSPPEWAGKKVGAKLAVLADVAARMAPAAAAAPEWFAAELAAEHFDKKLQKMTPCGFKRVVDAANKEEEEEEEECYRFSNKLRITMQRSGGRRDLKWGHAVPAADGGREPGGEPPGGGTGGEAGPPAGGSGEPPSGGGGGRPAKSPRLGSAAGGGGGGPGGGGAAP
jgi:hypothetical protein